MILINGTFILTPLVRKVTLLANEGMQNGHILPQFTVLKGREDMYGAINFVLLLACLFLAVFKPFDKNQRIIEEQEQEYK